MKWCFLCSIFFFLSCPGLIQAPSAKPGSGIPIGSGSQDTNNNLSPPGDPNASGNSNDPSSPENQKNQNLPFTLPSDRQWGLVRCDGNSLKTDEFNSNVKNFLSTSHDPNKMAWWVKCNFNDTRFRDWKGGVFIRGQVYFQGNKFNPVSQSQNLILAEQSYIEIHIVDHIQNTVVNPIKMQIVNLSSSISASNVNLVFKDIKGEVALKGAVKRNQKINDFTISGGMSYVNYINFRGTKSNYGGFIGLFEIPACSFLSCGNSYIAPQPQGL